MSDLSDALMSSPSAVTAGWSQLGRVLGGGGQASANAYQRGAMQGAQLADVMEQARRRRDANVGFSNITPDLVRRAQAGDQDAQSAIIANTIQAGGGNADQLANAYKTGQLSDLTTGLINAQRGGASISQLNPGLAILGGKPVDVSKIEDNTLINPTVAPNEQDAQGGNMPTAVGQSDIGLHLAQAGEAGAAAQRNLAEADRARAGIGADKAGNYDIVTLSDGTTARINKLTGETAPVTDASGKPVQLQAHGPGGSDAALKPEEIEEALGKPASGTSKGNPDYIAFKNYQTLHAQDDPRFSNDRFALSQYLQAKQGTQMAAAGAANAPTVDSDGNTVKPNMATSFSQALQTAGQGNQGSGSPEGKPPTNAAASVPKQNGVYAPTSEAQYNQLPPGTQYLDPSGVMRVKSGS